MGSWLCKHWAFGLVRGVDSSFSASFSFLRSPPAEPSSSTQSMRVQSIRQGIFRSQQASLKNRRLAQMMDRRPAVMAALRIKKQILKQRLGQPQQRISVKDRLTLRGRFRGGLRGRLGQRGSNQGRSPLVRQQIQTRGGRGNRRGGRGSFSRSQSLSNLSRSQSVQSFNGRQNFNTERINRGGRGRFLNRNSFNNQEIGRGGRGFRSRGGGYYRGNQDFSSRRGGRNSYFNNRGSQRSRGFRTRGGGRGRGQGRGRGGRLPPPTKEELDSQLDQYMATSRHELDRELDKYMSSQETWD